MADVLIGLHMPFHDPLERLAMEKVAEGKLLEHGVTATVRIVGTEAGYVAAQGHSIDDAKRYADIAEEAAWGVYGREIS